MLYKEVYKKVDRILIRCPEVVINYVKTGMDLKGIKAADLAVINNTTRSSVSRFLNLKKVIHPEECRQYVRSLGGALHLEKGSDDSDQILLDLKPRKLPELIRHYREVNSYTERSIVAVYEDPLAILAGCGGDPKDFIIKTNEQDHKGTIISGDGEHWKHFQISFISRYNTDFAFKAIISPRGNKIGFGTWLNKSSESNDCEKYRKMLNHSQTDDQLLHEFKDRTWDWLPASFDQGLIAFHWLDFSIEDVTEVYPVLAASFGEYNSLLQEASGVGPSNSVAFRAYYLSDAPQIQNVEVQINTIPNELIRTVKDSRDPVCDIDSEHELFEGEDGKPYVEAVPLIPIIPESIEAVGDVIRTDRNITLLCPMCAAKLRHGEEEAREGLIVKLNRKYKDGLKEAGANVSLLDVLFWNNIVEVKEVSSLKTDKGTIEHFKGYKKMLKGGDQRGTENERNG